jgi:putative membrane protein
MKRLISAFFTGVLALVLSVASAFSQAAESAEEFVEDASAKGLAEIEGAKVALEKGTSQDIKDFAQRMIEDHRAANQRLRDLARQKDLEMSDDASLMAQAKTMILQLREGESFDKAYANNQVQAHQETIELFRNYVRHGDDQDIKAFAEETLPTLEEHLQQAKKLAAAHGEDQRRDSDMSDQNQSQRGDIKKQSQRHSSAKGTGKQSSGAQAHS